MYFSNETKESSDPVFQRDDGKWYFHGCDIVTNLKSMTYGPYDTEQQAREHLDTHAALINGELIENSNNSRL
jgi:hypothetical protein